MTSSTATSLCNEEHICFVMSEQMGWKVDAVIYQQTKKTNEMKMRSTYVNNKRLWSLQLHVGTSHFSKPKRSYLYMSYISCQHFDNIISN